MDFLTSSAPLDSLELPHSLLEAPSPAFSNTTVRRAFVVWLCCGQRNQFRDVCNYYHHLEALEATLPAAARASSRHPEFQLFSEVPPTSSYLQRHFPTLYSQTHIDSHYLRKLETMKNENRYKLELEEKNGTTKQDIMAVSQMIGKYCKENKIPVIGFLNDFKEYAARCELKESVNNVGIYIKTKMIHEELRSVADHPKSVGFLKPNQTAEHKHTVNDCRKVLVTKDPKVSVDLNSEQLKLSSGITSKIYSGVLKCSVDDKNNSSKTKDSAKELLNALKTNDFNGRNNINDSKDAHNDGKIMDKISESPMRLLKRDGSETNMKSNAAFLNSHFLKAEVLKFRKI